MSDSIYIYNSLSRSKEIFEPSEKDRACMYVCGITPYSESHLGHARCYIVFDVIRRIFEYSGYKVFYVQNITDIDDKIIKRSKEESVSPEQIAKKYFSEFQDTMASLNVRPADLYPKVSESIEDIIAFVKELIKMDKAYESGGSVYFRISASENYGSLSGRNPEELVMKRQDPSDDSKQDPRDFALWKYDAEYGWPSPWGPGRPGWHIECSAMSKKYLGDNFDIHGGGLDLIFPHHENEIAQTEALTGKQPVNYWIHNGMVNLSGDKMSKSTGNYYKLNEIIEEYDPMVLRLYLLSTGYRQVLDFSFEALKESSKAYNKLIELKKLLSEIKERDNKLSPAGSLMDIVRDDFNTPRSIGEAFKRLNPARESIFDGTCTDEDIVSAYKVVLFIENVLGISLMGGNTHDNTEIEELIAQRNEYRSKRDFESADKIRDMLSSKGIDIKDTPTGTRWIKRR